VTEDVIWDLKDIKSKDPDVKWEAVNNLSKYLEETQDFRSKMIIKSFLSMINDPMDNVRETVYSTLIRHLSDKSRLETILLKGTKDKSPGIRSLSLEWLNANNHSSIDSQTISALQDSSEAVRKIAIDIVVQRNIPGVEKRLLELLKQEKGGARRSVIYALGQMKTAPAINTLIDIMQNQEFDDWTRNQAGSALEHLGDKELIIPFLSNLIDPNDYVKQTASSFLKKNEKFIPEIIIRERKLDYLALLKYATKETKQDFSHTIQGLTVQLNEQLQALTARLQLREQIKIQDLANEMNAAPEAIDILLSSFLGLELYPQGEGVFITRKGIISQLKTRFIENKSLVVSATNQSPPFDLVNEQEFQALLLTLEDGLIVFEDLFITKSYFEEVLQNFERNGVLNLQNVANDIQQPIELVKTEFINRCNPNNDGWVNDKEIYITKKFIIQKSQEIMQENLVLEINNFKREIGNPEIDIPLLVHLIEENNQGKWLQDIHVFLSLEEYKNIEENAIRIDEDRVKHLLEPINMNFPTFLASLQKNLEIQTFKTKGGQLVSLESLYPEIKTIVDEYGYISLKEYMESNKLDKQVSSLIENFLDENYEGSYNEEKTYFFKNAFLNTINEELQNQVRINFNVLGYKLNLSEQLLKVLIDQIFQIKGLINNLGEFLPLKGIIKEYKEILTHKNEFQLSTLYEILEVDNTTTIEKIRETLQTDPEIYFTTDGNKIISQKRAIELLIRFTKSPITRSKESIPLSQVSQETKLDVSAIVEILNTLMTNNLIPGRVENEYYYP
jgi:hypothetical protein